MDQFKRIASFVLALVMIVLMAPVQFITVNAEGQGVSISFADAANRTAFDATQQVWEQNGVTVTNDKAASNTAIADYAKPARFYANSKLTVEYPGMTEIVFSCNSAAYATDLNSSIVAQEGVTTAAEAVIGMNIAKTTTKAITTDKIFFDIMSAPFSGIFPEKNL